MLFCAETHSKLCKAAHSLTLIHNTRDGKWGGMLWAHCISKYKYYVAKYKNRIGSDPNRFICIEQQLISSTGTTITEWDKTKYKID